MAGSNYLKALFCISLIALFVTGCSSDDDVAAPTVEAVDTVPPAVPTLFAGEYYSDQGQVVLSWARNTTDADFAGIRITRTIGDQTISLVDSPRNIRYCQDTNPFPGLNTYSILAVDNAGNESAVASIEVELPRNHRTQELNQDTQ